MDRSTDNRNIQRYDLAIQRQCLKVDQLIKREAVGENVREERKQTTAGVDVMLAAFREVRNDGK